MLFKNEFLLVQFRLKPKISSRELVTSDCSKICPKICPFKKPVQKSLSQHKIMRKLRSYEEKGLLMQYHSINIEKLQKRMKRNFQIFHIKLDGVLETNLK